MHVRLPRQGTGMPQDYDWNLLKTFQAIACRGSVSAAARALGREQPSVSAALRRLEQHFGAALFERSTRGMVLTPAGHRVLAACDEVSGTLDSLADEFLDPTEVEAILTLRMISDVVAPPLDAALLALHRTYPRVEIRIDIAPWRRVLEGVRSARATVGVACDSRPNPSLAYQPLVVESQQLYCGRAHPLFGTIVKRPESLREEAFVLTGDDEPEELAGFRTTHQLGRRAGASVETLHEARKLIQMGFGIGFLPTSVAEAPEAADPLWPLLPGELLPRYPVFVVTQRDARHPPGLRRALRTFLDALAPCAAAPAHPHGP